MQLEKELGGWSHQLARFLGSFQLNGSSAPTILRDGGYNTTKQWSVVRTSTGLYTVTINLAAAGGPMVMPTLPFIRAWLDQAAAPVAPCKAHYVKGSWTLSTRTFQLQVQTVTTAPAASDGDAGDRLNFEISGSVSAIGTDPA